MYLINFGFTGIGLKKCNLLGRYTEYPVTTIRFFILTIVILSSESTFLVKNALHGLIQDKDWHIKNAYILRLEKRKAVAKSRVQAEAKMKDLVDMYKDEYYKTLRKLEIVENENRAMRKTIKIVNT